MVKADEHGRHPGNKPIGAGFDNQAQAGELKLQIRQEEGYANTGGKNAQRTALIEMFHQIGLSHQSVTAAHGSHRRQHIVANHIGQSTISQDIKGRAAPGVSPAAAAKKGEGSIDLTRQNKPVQQAAKVTATYRPLFQRHLLLYAGDHANDSGPDYKDKDYPKGNYLVRHSSPTFRYQESRLRFESMV